YFAKEFTDLPLKSIGTHFGGRDHSTVIHSVQAITELIEKDRTVAETVDRLKSYLN
ncbi:MAG: helix-turn-helix domain-containing protein, partial [Spirosomataceae bacterium]